MDKDCGFTGAIGFDCMLIGEASSGCYPESIEDNANRDLSADDKEVAPQGVPETLQILRVDRPSTTLYTDLPTHILMKPLDEPNSVIHVPKRQNTCYDDALVDAGTTTTIGQEHIPTKEEKHEVEDETPLESSCLESDERSSLYQTHTAMLEPISTNMNGRVVLDDVTPRAQSWKSTTQGRYSPSITLQNSTLQTLEEANDNTTRPDNQNDCDYELKSLLQESWILCSSLAQTGHIHKESALNITSRRTRHELAWKSCWQLCQRIYDARDEIGNAHGRSTLDLCRDFCQALFSIRMTEDDRADGVLRVSFELNNHLYNTHDQTLPDDFQKRTLDFYLALCHRLMKQRDGARTESELLLRACWELAEVLVALCEANRDRTEKDEMLVVAIQACWTLTDLLRNRWTAILTMKLKPRTCSKPLSKPSGRVVNRSSQQAPSHFFDSENTYRSMTNRAVADQQRTSQREPETPTTEFEDTPASPLEYSSIGLDSPSLVAPTNRSQMRHSSDSSNPSIFSQASCETEGTVRPTITKTV